ncbi:hypothetical protein B0H67DRAFT_54204 [Lasiosphaeris hirsuta]|uniref:poly(ADP-ribose) glycohydrolase n=1 Tax=Lasiosphaeris hirsuta TaxID=260670 RepID=A0AA40BAW1_9PEZI|nr:hypothetical protein B0H67DRAFT_54204 [Lasiosphaeris hirsuta]
MMTLVSSFYQLPSSPTYTCIDRFGLHPESDAAEDTVGAVPFWPILHTLLSQPTLSTKALIDLLETISTTLCGTAAPAGDHALLGRTVDHPCRQDFFTKWWPQIVDLALQMPDLFPTGRLPILLLNSQGNTAQKFSISRRQTACLVVHQFLRTLRAPAWRHDGTHDFGIWYGSAQRHESAALMYLEALFTYFEEVVCDAERLDWEGWRVVYTLKSVNDFDKQFTRVFPLSEVEVLPVERYDVSPASLGLPGSAAVVSANKYVGFGQSATQEEVHVGSSPEACPAVLVTPPLGDAQVLVVEGAQAMTNITGQKRDIRIEAMSMPEGGEGAWRDRKMLFMDALELDLVESEAENATLPDFLPGNMEREVRKAYTAFGFGGFDEVRTGLWGCGAFGGDPVVKMLLLWYAASMSAVKLIVVCDKQSEVAGKQFRELVPKIRGRYKSANGIKELLDSAPKSLLRGQTALWFKAVLVEAEGES